MLACPVSEPAFALEQVETLWRRRIGPRATFDSRDLGLASFLQYNARKSLKTGKLVNFASWNQLEGWLRQVEVLRTAA